ncbi:hypothetical protein V5O48_015989 [Marasmius crinis-equi]|uniref:Uncharacterized protein n=1 Tax=Marasmius crinis-equi TaxID=585013 RepID=A0ABR3ET17_9AGAR
MSIVEASKGVSGAGLVEDRGLAWKKGPGDIGFGIVKVGITRVLKMLPADSPPKLFSAQDARSIPSLLTQNANPKAAIRAHEGLVGNVFLDHLITTPNMKILYEPPLNLRRVRFRRDNHFGVDDPLHHPQPFNRQLAFLACIRVPHDDPALPELDTAFKILGDSDFVESPGYRGLGRIHRALLDRFKYLSLLILAKFPVDAPKLDDFVRDISNHLRRMLDSLESPASRAETFFRFACAQRHALYLLARYEWVQVFRAKFEGKEYQDQRIVIPTIVGAFTSQEAEADSLFRAGIPVWYSHRLSDAPGVRVDSVASFISDAITNRLIQRFGDGFLDCSDATPPHRVIYEGLAAKPERYFAMANYMSSRFLYPSSFGNTELRSSTSLIRTAQSSSPLVVVPFGFYQSQPPSLSSGSSRGKPYSGRLSKANVPNSNFLERNPLFPPSVPAWSQALESLSHHNTNSPPPPGCDRGYFLPPARVFANVGHPAKQIVLLRSWLKIRDVTLFRLSCSPAHMSAKDWKAYIEVGGGDTSRISDTQTGKVQKQMYDLITGFLATHQLGVEFSKLPGLSALWKGQPIPETTLPSTRVVHEILYELNELAFRQELVALDEELDTSGGSDQGHRYDLLDSCWKGERTRVSGYDGLGSESLEDRLPYLEALRAVMMTWKGNKPLDMLDGFPGDKSIHNFVKRCEHVERALATFYTNSCLLVFGREAMVPHRLSV